MDNKTMLLVLMVVLIAFIVLLAVLGIVFIIALRKRAPVVKVLMAPLAAQKDEDDEEPEEEEAQEEEPEEQLAIPEAAALDEKPAEPAPKPVPKEEPEDEEDDDDNDETVFVMEGADRVRYDRSFEAKICQLKNETKEWYSQLKNELLSYELVKTRMSWRRETYRVGRMPFARIVVRGKTLCLLVAVEPSGYAGTKFNVEDVSNVAATADTPTLYRIKSVRRLKYAKEMIAGIMKELKVYKNTQYEPVDFFVPYEGDMALMSRGMIKRVVTSHTRTFKVEEGEDGVSISEVDASEVGAAAAADETTESTAENTESTETDV